MGTEGSCVRAGDVLESPEDDKNFDFTSGIHVRLSVSVKSEEPPQFKRILSVGV